MTGEFCARCGQRREPPLHSLGEIAYDAFEATTNLDSRLWRTLLPLAFRPGYLTREFLDGRRARYLPPVRLYLVISVFFFVLLQSLPDADPTRVAVGVPAGAPARSAGTSSPDAKLCTFDIEASGIWAALIGRLRAGCEKALRDGGRTLGEAFLRNVPSAMFFFLPLLALVMKLMYWRPKRYYVEHLLFFVHTHAFVFFLMALLALLEFASGGAPWAEFLGACAWVYALWYVYRAIRRVYGQGRLASLAKATVLAFAYVFFGATILALTVLYSVATL